MTLTTTKLLAQSQMSVYLELARLQAMTEWWHWLLLLLVCVAVVVYVGWFYVRDSAELSPGLRWLLLVLRVAAFAGILVYFFDLERRAERQLVKNSRVLLLVDTSLSMGLRDAGAQDAAVRNAAIQNAASDRRRIDDVLAELEKGDWIERLRRDHDVLVYRFDETEVPLQVASYGKRVNEASPDQRQRDRSAQWSADVRGARRMALLAGLVCGLSGVAWLVFVVWGRGAARDEGSWAWLAGVVGLLVALVVLAVANLRYPDVGLLATLGLAEPQPPASETAIGAAVEPDVPAMAGGPPAWGEALAPRGTQTRLGDALRFLIDKERGGPLAGIVLLTDGRSNAGLDCDQAVLSAADAGVSLFPIGLGTARRPSNVGIVDVEAPARVYPADGFTLTAYLKADGLAGRNVKVELFSQAGEPDGENGAEQFEGERRVPLPADGEIVPLRFEISPGEIGRRTYRVRVAAPAQDQDPRDNAASATVDIVQRKQRVLLFAGGPTREFRFLRNLLFRDQGTTLDVLLQTGRPGMSQEADTLLFDFPRTAAQLFEYDTLVAFDPDWLALDELQVGLLERWVADQAGGLVVVAGPVNTPEWAGRRRNDPRLETVQALYPVVFYGRGSATLSIGRFASETPWPLQFTRDGMDAEFLWLEDDALLNEQAWAAFRGVYGYFAVKDPKPGARVYARFSDPGAAIDRQLPVYLAGQFYGAGRVFFQASGEMWRIRAVDDAYFERYYTKLVRWVSQGRLLRDSTRGVLLVDKQRCLLGEPVEVRAMLTDAQHAPLTAEEVAATLLHPDGRRTTLLLRRAPQAAREGMYQGQFTALLEGKYRIELEPPHGGEKEMLTQDVRCRIPALETERPQRHDALLKDLAEKTGGAYYVGLDAALNRSGAGRVPVANLLVPQDQVTYLPGTPDREFDRLLMTWLLVWICGALCLEWLIRRLGRLA